MITIQPVLLAGGSGSRLWPLSRKSYPKQFSKLLGEESLFQKSAKRLMSSDKLFFKNPLILTNSDFRFIVGQQLQAVGIDPGTILIEPSSKNTGPAILAASLYAFGLDPDVVLLVVPSDHIISDTVAFQDTILKGFPHAGQGKIVTFGVGPTHPETGYGYLEIGNSNNKNQIHVKSFVEKPNLAKAEKMLASGNYLWNVGMFLFKAKNLITNCQSNASSMLKSVEQAVTKGKADLGFWRIDPKAWSNCENISIDYAVMEKTHDLVAVPMSTSWADVGEWRSVWEQQKPDKNGLVTSGNVTAIDCTNVLLRSEDPNQVLVGLGLDNIIAVAMPDAVLVANKDRAQDVKEVVSILKTKNIIQADVFPKDYRPWGWFETLAIIEGQFRVKRILVNPGAALSLQSHKHRSEHWVVVVGEARVTIKDKVSVVLEGQSAYIPTETIHRLENFTETPLIVIEIQSGTYLGEDDIIRYEDIYTRQ